MNATNGRQEQGFKPVPYDLAAETALLAACLAEPAQLLTVGDVLDSAADFYQETNGYIYAAMLAVARRGQLTVPGLAAELKRAGRLDAIGGAGAIARLYDEGWIKTAHAAEYARLVAGCATKRRMISVGGRIAGLGHDDGPADELVAAAQGLMLDFTGRAVRGAGLSAAEIATRHAGALDERLEATRKGGTVGLATGFAVLDDMLGGLRRKYLYIVAARPSVGKSAFASDLIRYVARPQERRGLGKRVLFFSLEMDTDQIMDRLVAAELSMNTVKLTNGWLNDGPELQSVTGAQGEIGGWSYHVDDTAGLSINDLCNRARAYRARASGLDLIIVDHLQLMAGDRSDNRNLELGSITSGLHKLAKELDVPVVALSQLSRGVESRADHRPSLGDLRESGRIEEDADVVILLYRDQVYNPDAGKPDIAEFNIAKNRTGPTGVQRLLFQREHTRFVNLTGRDY